MKILHLIDSGGLYGAEMVVLNLVQEQLRQGDQPLILSAGTPDVAEKPLEAAARARGLPVLPWRMRAGMNLPQAWKILRYARREGFDVLHSHGYKFNILMSIWPRWLRRIPLVSTLHGYTSGGKRGAMALYEALDKWSLRRLDRVVIVSPAMLAIPALAALPLRNVVEIPNGIDLAVLEHGGEVDAETEAFLRSHRYIVGAFGRLSAEKGLSLLLQAVARLREQGLDVGLLLVGEGPERARIESLAIALDLKKDVLLAGYHAPPYPYMRRCTVIAMPSLTEGLPMTLLEAMALRVPVVASRVGAIPDVLEDGRCGVLVVAGSSSALVRALRDAVTSAAEQYVELGYKKVNGRYTAMAMAKAYLSVYLDFF